MKLITFEPDHVEFDVPMVAPGLNEWQTIDWRERSRIKKNWETQIMFVNSICYATHNARIKMGRVRCIITRGFWCHPLDDDNVLAKPIMDAMVKHEFIIDDSPKYVRTELLQEKMKRKDIHTNIKLLTVPMDEWNKVFDL